MMNSSKKIICSTIFLLLASFAFAPDTKSIVIVENQPVGPFKKLVYAVGMVETMNDTMVYNPVEEAIGFLQIRPIRLKDYNERTGSNYSMNDMYNYNISEKIFLFYASQIGPYNFERIAREWNGSGIKTIEYWKQVKEYL
jgi:hypothetical protein